MSKVTLKSMRENPLYNDSMILHGNGKLLDFDNPETGEKIRYAQFNTRAVIDCPFRSKGCEAVCYATKGNHNFFDVKASRSRSYESTRRADFVESIVYTIKVEKQSKRYLDAVMRVRIHESGDFYSLQYLKKWVSIWAETEGTEGVAYTLYTKSFPFFLKLSATEKAVINRMLKSGKLAINWSVDDTTSKAQLDAYLDCVRTFPKANTYRCTEHVESTAHDNICDCADCAKCGTCNKTDGKVTVVKIHSASKADMEVYRNNKAEA